VDVLNCGNHFGTKFLAANSLYICSAIFPNKFASFGEKKTTRVTMKRSRTPEDLNSGNLQNPTEMNSDQESFKLYLRTRTRDSSPQVVETNNLRYRNAIYELSFYLNLSKDAREKSWLYFQKLQDLQHSTPDVNPTSPR
jgi:hypothetical protein